MQVGWDRPCEIRYAAIAQPVERILGKDEVASSNLASSSILSNEYAAIAQPVERILGKDEVASSNLASSSKIGNLRQKVADFTYYFVTLNYNGCRFLKR